MKNARYFTLLLLALFNLNTLLAQHSISGQITCLGANEAVSGQEVELSGTNISDMIAVTDANGNYNFDNLPAGDDYTLTIERDGAVFSGVSTFDLVLMSMQILGIQNLPTPFHLLAADLNNSGAISTFDMVVMRQIILGISTSFPNVPTFKFATSDYDPANGTGSVGGATVTNLQADTTIDFVQVRMGDLNGTASCQ